MAVPTFRAPGYLLVHHWAVSLVLVAKQQDAGVSLLIGCRPPLGHQHLQLFLFLRRQLHTVFLRHHIHPHFLIFFLWLLTFYTLPAIITKISYY